jgi:CRISPR-associated protein Csb1
VSKKLTYDLLSMAVAGTGAAFRSVTKLQPVGGAGDRVFPATYANGVYATEKRRLRSEDGTAREVDCVLLNSVASEANHAEEALLHAIVRGDIRLPLIEVDFSEANGQFRKPLQNLTSLAVPHRLADAILRDCALADGTRFSKSSYSAQWGGANLWNATPIYKLCPTALVFGMWGSPEKPGGLGAKFERAFVSEIVAVETDPVPARMGFRIDPIGASKDVLVRKTEGAFEVADAKSKGGEKPSTINHGNIVYPKAGTVLNGGVRCHYAEQTTVISLGALRKLRFPIDGAPAQPNDVGRTVLAAIGLCAATFAAERGTSLRSRCHLWPTEARTWQLLDKPGQKPDEFQLTGDEAAGLLKDSVAAAVHAGLDWMDEKLMLKPTPELVELIRQSQEISASRDSAEGE